MTSNYYSLREKIDLQITMWVGSDWEKMMNNVMRLFREDQKRRCGECHNQVVENITAMEMERMK